MGKPLKAIGNAVGNLFAQAQPKMPKIEKPEAIIAPPSQEVAARAARERLKIRAQRGREGTIYSTAYRGTNLGGTA